MDTNKDGGIDRAEWHAQGHDDASFDRMDTNHDGKIDSAEWAAQQGEKKGWEEGEKQGEEEGEKKGEEEGGTNARREGQKIEEEVSTMVAKEAAKVAHSFACLSLTAKHAGRPLLSMPVLHA